MSFFSQESWRVKYDLQPEQRNMKTFLYSFTWVRYLAPLFFIMIYFVVQEDPYDDLRHLIINNEDSLLAITSGGDNILHYILEGKPRIVCK